MWTYNHESYTPSSRTSLITDACFLNILLSLIRKNSTETLFHSSEQKHHSCLLSWHSHEQWKVLTNSTKQMQPFQNSDQPLQSEGFVVLTEELSNAFQAVTVEEVPQHSPCLPYTGFTLCFIRVCCHPNQTMVSFVFFLNSVLLSNVWPTNFGKPNCSYYLEKETPTIWPTTMSLCQWKKLAPRVHIELFHLHSILKNRPNLYIY